MKPAPAGRHVLAAPRRLFYGWWMVIIGAAFAGLSGGLYQTGFSIYFLPITSDLQISRASTSLIVGIARAEGGLMSPLAGWLIDRQGPRRMLIVGTMLAGVGYLLVSRSHNFVLFLVIYTGVVSSGFVLGFNPAARALANQWFSRRRAMAIAVVLAGVGAGGAILTPLLGLGVAYLGWRDTMALSGVALLAVGLPLALLVRNTPEEVGLRPDGDVVVTESIGAERGHPRPVDQARDFTVKEAMKSAPFWFFAAALAIRQGSRTAIQVHFVPLLVWKGISEPQAAGLVGVVALLMVVLRLGMGWIATGFSLKRFVAVTCLAGTLRMAVLLVTSSEWYLFLFVVLFAVMEGSSPITWAMVGDTFGRKSFATLSGLIESVNTIGAVALPILTGWIFDRTETYTWALYLFAGLLVTCAAMFWFLPQPRSGRRQGATAISATA